MRLAIINQRYGLEVNGGSEYYTRILAEHLAPYHEVEVLTTKAKSYATWENEYEADEEVIHGIKVRRFRVDKPRQAWLQGKCEKLMDTYHINNRWISNIWVNAQGPLCTELIAYIEKHAEDYDAFLFTTYLYYPTAVGLAKVKDKAILIPTAHDEHCIYYKIFEELFASARGMIFLTEEERDFVWKKFDNAQIPSIVTAVGVDVPSDVDAKRFREKYEISRDYLIYAGRVDEQKGCGEMFEAYQRYIATAGEKGDITIPELVVVGQQFIDIPENEHIHYLGFVSEQDKFDAISGARALWLPSQFESLSIAVLEAMSLGVPVLVNGKCLVLRGHVDKSQGGLWYSGVDSCVETLKRLMMDDGDVNIEAMSKNARQYVETYYEWSVVIQKINAFLSSLFGNH